MHDVFLFYQYNENSILLSDCSLSDNLGSILLSEDFASCADATLTCHSHDLPVHRRVLSARSPFFRDFFSKNQENSGTIKAHGLFGDFEVSYAALVLVMEYIYSGRVGQLPDGVCICVDKSCSHAGCRPVVDFMVEVLYASYIFQIFKLADLFQRRLIDTLEKVAADDVPLIISVSNMCNKSCQQLLNQCIVIVAQSDLDMVALEKKLPPGIVKQIVEYRVKFNLTNPCSDNFPDKHQRRIYSALDSDDVDLVRMLLKEGHTTLDDSYALHYVVEFCDSKITMELLDLELADVNHRNLRGYTVLHLAAMRKDPKIIISLLMKGASPSDLTQDGRKAVQIAKRMTKSADFYRISEEGKASSIDMLCIEILEQAERQNPLIEEASVSLALSGDDMRGRLLYLENRVALARLMFPMEARVVMDVAQVDGTLEFTLGSSSNPTHWNSRAAMDLDESPIQLKDVHHARLKALAKTVELEKKFFPRCSAVLDTIIKDDLMNLPDQAGHNIFKSEDFASCADAIITCDSCDLPVHRGVLSARSPFFRDFFSKNQENSGAIKAHDLLGDFKVGYEALLLIMEYVYSGRVGQFPKGVCICVDESCSHAGCHPAVVFMVEVLYASFTFHIFELANLFQRHLIDILERVASDDVPRILSVANMCNSSCQQLLNRCIDIVAQSDLDMVALEKKVPPDIVKQIVEYRVSLGLMNPHADNFPNKHARRIHRALDNDDVELVRMLLKEGHTTLDDAYALHYAVEHCDSKITMKLLDLELADVNHRNLRGYTVLHVASMRKDPKIIVSLLTKGARPSDLTQDGRKAVHIAKRMTKSADYYSIPEEGKASPKDMLCVEILEQAERRDPLVGEASVSLALSGDDMLGKLLYLENRVALARIMFPLEARVAMDIAQVDGTLEFTLGSNSNSTNGNNRSTAMDLNDTPFQMKEEHRARMKALARTVELGKKFFPRSSAVLDKIMDDELTDLTDVTDLAGSNRDTSEEKRRRHYEDHQNVLQRAFHEDRQELDLIYTIRNLTGHKRAFSEDRQESDLTDYTDLAGHNRNTSEAKLRRHDDNENKLERSSCEDRQESDYSVLSSTSSSSSIYRTRR